MSNKSEIPYTQAAEAAEQAVEQKLPFEGAEYDGVVFRDDGKLGLKSKIKIGSKQKTFLVTFNPESKLIPEIGVLTKIKLLKQTVPSNPEKGYYGHWVCDFAD